jgi:hypothetical protein
LLLSTPGVRKALTNPPSPTLIAPQWRPRSAGLEGWVIGAPIGTVLGAIAGWKLMGR